MLTGEAVALTPTQTARGTSGLSVLTSVERISIQSKSVKKKKICVTLFSIINEHLGEKALERERERDREREKDAQVSK